MQRDRIGKNLSHPCWAHTISHRTPIRRIARGLMVHDIKTREVRPVRVFNPAIHERFIASMVKPFHIQPPTITRMGWAGRPVLVDKGSKAFSKKDQSMASASHWILCFGWRMAFNSESNHGAVWELLFGSFLQGFETKRRISLQISKPCFRQ